MTDLAPPAFAIDFHTEAMQSAAIELARLPLAEICQPWTKEAAALVSDLITAARCYGRAALSLEES